MLRNCLFCLVSLNLFCFASLTAESFEGGEYALAGWSDNTGAKSWEFTTEDSSSGDYALTSSPEIAEGDIIVLEIEVTTNRIAFDFNPYFQPYDQAKFYIDGIYKGNLHFTSTGWRELEYNIDYQPHTFRWEVSRQGSYYPEENHFMLLDNIRFGYQLPGEGTKINPYLISSGDDFAYIYSEREHLSGNHFALAGDIDLTGFGHNSGEPEDETAEFYPLGYDSSCKFSGSFDGRGFKISSLTYHAEEYPFDRNKGIFGFIAEGGVVRNLHVSNFDIIGHYSLAGIAGTNEGAIYNCSVSGRIEASGQYGAAAAGIAADNSGTVRNCSADIEILSSYGAVGGIAAKNSGGKIQNCSAVNRITCSSGGVSGIAANLSSASGNGIISGCTANNIFLGSETKNGFYYGGICSTNNTGCSITGCLSTGSVYGNQYVGGITGKNKGEILCCESRADIFGGTYCGAAVGENDTNYDIAYCTASGDVLGWGEEIPANASGFCGLARDPIEQSFSCGFVSSAEGDSNYAFAYPWQSGLIIDCFYNYSTALAGERFANTSEEPSNAAYTLYSSTVTDSLKYINRGWNFDSMWEMGSDMPVLREDWPIFFADRNADMQTGMSDLDTFRQKWCASPTADNSWREGTDFNKDGDINNIDFAFMAKIW
ncbi:The GLUG motif [Sedimentisphaera cyanobacteriorum]|uniref:The GLUG motif n=1 Tax=Sedimentisphaera cyanobacteriorum TaxID=1940790 RepID=A0A1Q2HSA5_9BACT|nr:GLUG motif-containing protein [Sedimentisphaera cyanobacteriorum]AQQ10113.1 The GLUG motif [Sedimentisphaera cyanobacteriorum]